MFFSGFAGEFANQLSRSRAEEADRAEKQAGLEIGILQHLATSPDPEIQSHALAGMLDYAGPRKFAKGLSGFLGKSAQNPALPTIRQLISQGRQIETPEHVPGMRVEEGAPSQLPGERLSGTGAPQAEGVGFTTPPPPGPATDPTDLYQPPRTTSVPRQVFRTPDQQAELTARATTRGTLAGKVDVLRGEGGSPLSPEEEELLFPGRSLLTAGTVQGKAAPAGALDNSGRPLTPDGYYQTKADPRDPSKVVYFPTAAPAGVANQAAINARATFQHYVGPDGKRPGVWRVTRDGSKPPEFVGYQAQKGSYLQYVDPDTQEVSYIAAPPVYVAGQTLQATSQPPGAQANPGAAPAPPGPPVGGVVAPGAGGAAPAVGGGQPGRAVAPPPGRTSGAVGATPPHGIPGGRKRALKEEEGAFIGPNGEPQVGRAFLDAGTGKYYSVQDPSQEAVGFVPGAEGAAITQNYSAANNTLVMIHAAMKALEEAGLTTSNDPQQAAALLAKFYQGTLGADPAGAAVASLTNLAALQGATQYVRSNSRSYQMFQQASLHLPRPPSERVAALTQKPIVGRLTTPENAALLGGHGWDSFQSMYEKLKQAETMITQGKKELATLTGKTQDRAIGAPPPPGPGGAGGGPTVGERRMINGQLGEWDGRNWVAVAVGGGGR